VNRFIFRHPQKEVKKNIMKKLSTFLALATAATILSGCYVSPYGYYNRGGQCPPPELPPIKVEVAPVKLEPIQIDPIKVEVEKKKPQCPDSYPCRPACPY